MKIKKKKNGGLAVDKKSLEGIEAPGGLLAYMANIE